MKTLFPCALVIGLVISASASLDAAAAAELPVETETSWESSVVSTRGYSRPIGAIEFSSSVVENRRLGPYSHPVNRRSSGGSVIFYEDGGVRDAGQRLSYDKWGRVCRTIGEMTVCRGADAPER
jgi:hypothetical protein